MVYYENDAPTFAKQVAVATRFFYYENDTPTFTKPVAVAAGFFSHCVRSPPGVAFVFLMCCDAGAAVCRSMGVYRKPQ